MIVAASSTNAPNTIKYNEAMPVNTLRVFSTQGPSVVVFGSDPTVEVVKWCDRFTLIVPKNERDRDGFFRAFFDWMADKFESAAEVERNLDNISSLLRVLQDNRMIQEGSRVLDFGCGTGLSVRTAGHCGFDITGFDYSKAMCARAQIAGMSVLNEGDLHLSDGRFDGVIASYVFHLQTGEEHVRRIPGLLKPGGGLSVNFHKGRGREWADRILLKSGMTCCSEAESSSGHGQVVVYAKRR